ncbi:hypothetical protein [Kangiella marina]|uniref:Uncharacterized protein n=1 Tax=Kangiella marina TaxID=1079178 RepID=A0ABP8IJC1_9GAMM
MKQLQSTVLSSMVMLAKVVIVLGLLSAFSVDATQLRKQNLTQLIDQSNSIIHGTVTAVSDGISEKGIPYTEVTISVADSAKGKVKKDSDYTFRQFGLLKPREMDNGKKLLAVAPEGFPRWHKDETVVAFLYKPASKTGFQTTVGLAQGKLAMVNGKLSNQFNNIGLFDGVNVDQALLTSEESNMLTLEGAVDAGTFMNLVNRAVSEGWIENGEMK